MKNIAQLILSPAHAWKDIETEEYPVETIVSRGLYPLMAIMLLTVFVKPLYSNMPFDLIQLLQIAIIQFVALFIAMFCGRHVMDHFLPICNSTGASDPVATGTVAAYGTGLMTIIQIVENLIPIELTIIQILPLFAAICIWKSAPYLDVEPRAEIKFMIFSIAALILPVIFINILMSYILN